MRDLTHFASQLLNGASVERAVASIYYAIRVVKHNQQINDIGKGFIVSGLDTEPSLEEKALGDQILSSIEALENKPISSLDPRSREGYTRTLANLLQDIVQSKLQYDVNRGQDLLAQFRSGDAYWQ